MSSRKNKAAKNKMKRAIRREFLGTVHRFLTRRQHQPHLSAKELRQMLDATKSRPDLIGRLPVGINGAIHAADRRERLAENAVKEKADRKAAYEKKVAAERDALATALASN